jgi:glycosyltransferase involved in cell wall biosynthesis
LRIAVFVESRLHTGGGFQQTVSLVQQLRRISGHEIVTLTTSREVVQELRSRGIDAELRSEGSVNRMLEIAAGLNPGIDRILRSLRRVGLRSVGRNLDRLLDALNIDLVYFSAPTYTAVRLAEHPFIFTVWDLCHRDQPEFPEVSHDREFERREHLLKAVLPKAVAVLADSEICAAKIGKWYGVDPARIAIVPFAPSTAVRRYVAGECAVTVPAVRSKYTLPDRYVFYPAQTWPHKNHVYVLDALAHLERHGGPALDVVFCGSDKGNTDYIRAHARALGILSRLHLLGFVDDEDIPAIYDGALALVMPTYFGSTNIPPLEAAAIGCPVVYADFPDFRAQMGDAALYCDLMNPASLAAHLHTLLTDTHELERLRTAGRRLAAEMAEVTYEKRLRPILDAFAYKQRRWRAGPAQ